MYFRIYNTHIYIAQQPFGPPRKVPQRWSMHGHPKVYVRKIPVNASNNLDEHSFATGVDGPELRRCTPDTYSHTNTDVGLDPYFNDPDSRVPYNSTHRK